jgi:glutathione peroxidase-family protein
MVVSMKRTLKTCLALAAALCAAILPVQGEPPMPNLYDFVLPETGGAISWNFNKFLIGRDGKVLRRYGSRTAPDDADLLADLEAALAAGMGR